MTCIVGIVDKKKKRVVMGSDSCGSNPPYKYGKEFVETALANINTGNKVAMFLKTLFLESKTRKHLFTINPPKFIYVSSSILMCAKNSDFEKMIEGGGSAVSYSWFVWEKGFKGDTIIKWFN